MSDNISHITDFITFFSVGSEWLCVGCHYRCLGLLCFFYYTRLSGISAGKYLSQVIKKIYTFYVSYTLGTQLIIAIYKISNKMCYRIIIYFQLI